MFLNIKLMEVLDVYLLFHVCSTQTVTINPLY